ncbi:MAG: glycosyltransferase family 39 protein [Candidatus Gastranaerophilales bacterium]|nr:glycosyltransferase family 39 protein [Candidatus Gastranaerophilales bacterium]
MVNFFKSDKGLIFLLVLLFFGILPVFYLHQGTFLIDTGRELYISQQVAQGGVLYKDILNIYGPFAYQLMALLFNLFGQSITVAYNSGIINSFVIVITLFLLSREFLNKGLSFLISTLSIFSLVFTTHLFNTNIPYSYGMAFALSSLLLSMLFLIKFSKTEKTQFAYLSSFFAGLSVVNKYEFFLYPIVLLFAFSKPLNLKQKLSAFTSFLIIPIFCFSNLFLNGLTLVDIQNAIKTMIAFATSNNMKIFYSTYGNIFEPTAFKRVLETNLFVSILGFIPLTNLIFFISKTKKIYKDKAKFFFCTATIIASIKFLLFMNVKHMGTFIFPLCLIMFFVLIQNTKIKEQIKYFFLAFLILVFASHDINSVNKRNYLLETSKGNVYTVLQAGIPIYNVAEYINKNTKKEDKVLVVPEGAIINFLTDRKTDNLYHNLDPLYYLGAFGEDDVMNNFTKNPMDYIVVFPIDMTEFGSKYFCDYAIHFCEMINSDYNLVEEIDEVKIYKRKNI